MRFDPRTPHAIVTGDSVPRVMRRVLYALIPGIAVACGLFGWGVLVQVVIASAAALAAEALMLLLRGKTPGLFLRDGSALVCAWLLAISLPALAPWWVSVVGVVFAIVVAKHLYGGLGCNPFNPAMVGYAVLLVSFPREMSAWPAPAGLFQHADLAETLQIILSGRELADGVTAATPLDAVKTGLASGSTLSAIDPDALITNGRRWLGLAFLGGGLWLVYTRAAAWQIPVGMLSSLLAIAAVFYLFDPQHNASPWFHLFGGATLLGAFFIATDPVSASTTPRGRWVYGAGIGLLTYIIRSFGGYPDGVAFAVLLMNMSVPTIDYYTRPRVFGA